MAAWIQERTDSDVKTEQTVPIWTKRDPKGNVVQGKLDVKWMEGRKNHALDVSVAATSTPSAAAQKSRAAGANVTVDGRVQEKRHRYPEHTQAPFLH
eukprot:2600964-Prorocentrum_lima.AAC.1